MTVKTDTTDATESKRRTAINQLGGPYDTQLYYDTVRERPVVLRHKDGWGTVGRRDYMERTWCVQEPRCYISDAGCELSTITQRTKLERMELDRYQTLPDETVDQILETATEKNIAWAKANTPAIPTDGPGGVNVYVDGEWLDATSTDSETQVTAKDDPFEPEQVVTVAYDETGIDSVTLEDDGDAVSCTLVSSPDSSDEPYRFRADGDDRVVELRHDTECEDHHETEYDLSGVDL